MPRADVAEPVQEGGEGEAAVHFWVGLCGGGGIEAVVVSSFFLLLLPCYCWLWGCCCCDLKSGGGRRKANLLARGWGVGVRNPRPRAGPLLIGGACDGVKRWVLIGRKACECRWLGSRVRGGVVRVRSSPRDCTAEARQDLNVLLGVREAASSI